MGSLRSAIVVLLALAVGFATVLAYSSAKGGLEARVICADGGAVTVLLDADGNPAAPLPDYDHQCCLVSLDMPASDQARQRREAFASTDAWPGGQETFVAAVHYQHSARGPPPRV